VIMVEFWGIKGCGAQFAIMVGIVGFRVYFSPVLLVGFSGSFLSFIWWEFYVVEKRANYGGRLPCT
jgi:hypothetical protein